MNSLKSNSVEATRALGRRLGQTLSPGAVVCLHGDLGAGKTQFVKGLIAGLTAVAEEEVNSPTFVYLNLYEGTLPVYHFDLYRLDDASDFLGLGFDEYLESEGICCLEWSERISELIPHSALHVTIQHLGETSRSVSFEGLPSTVWERLTEEVHDE